MTILKDLKEYVIVKRFCKHSYDKTLPGHRNGCLATGIIKVRYDDFCKGKAELPCPNCLKILKQEDGELY